MSNSRGKVISLSLVLFVLLLSVFIIVLMIFFLLYQKPDNKTIIQRKLISSSSSLKSLHFSSIVSTSSISSSSNIIPHSRRNSKKGTLLGLGGIVDVSNGGTGVGNLPLGYVLIGNRTSPVFTNKLAPTGDFIGTTDTQTLTNKTLGNTLSINTQLTLTGTTFTFNMPNIALNFQNSTTAYWIFSAGTTMDISSSVVNLNQGVKLLFPSGDVTYLAAPLANFIIYNNPSLLTVTAVSLGTTGTIRIDVVRYGTQIFWYLSTLTIALGASTTTELNITSLIPDLFCRNGTFGQTCLMNNNGSTIISSSVIIQNTGTGFANVRLRFSSFTGNVSFLSPIAIVLSL
jgi:hypothetical protein